MSYKVAIVTGASGGIGYLSVIELVKKGYQVVATVRSLEKENQLQKDLESQNIEHMVKIEQLDVTNEESIQIFKEKLDQYESIDVLVNNAGNLVAGFAEEITMDDYRKQFETNVFGLIAVTKLVIPLMRKQESGKIINLSSLSGLMAFPSLSAYAASKHAVEGFSESLRLELKPFGVDVVIIEPGPFKTSMVDDMSDLDMENDSPYLEYKQNRITTYNSMDWGNPLEVAETIASIATSDEPDLRYIVGTGMKERYDAKRNSPWKDWEKMMLPQ
ncbi:SDR family oxidoreductase [Chengkuizengella sediminis]|uniref:SDR family oxidoreductase n=1 Tax=Chengkuizengella sediminis TaxID=1885917 RepID=UPI001389D4BC|nr:SDR family oxidoreductase [Chengkuizengella sediminis]NDI35107.1 SDR family oxidoreductase [Chengkuizengella sediminis]